MRRPGKDGHEGPHWLGTILFLGMMAALAWALFVPR